ncbi:hypothetical protein FNE72_28295 [Klebsiella pneumoniae]|uniref:hypothetical protein n=1 Tax=Klebsiella pneumoniae TaxID=573 RepID=UPI00124BB373|nr:hypothetical protein FNE72_28295 [Klebsiella pneumoniae]
MTDVEALTAEMNNPETTEERRTEIQRILDDNSNASPQITEPPEVDLAARETAQQQENRRKQAADDQRNLTEAMNELLPGNRDANGNPVGGNTLTPVATLNSMSGSMNMAALKNLAYVATSGSIATAEQAQQIGVLWTQLGVPQGSIFTVAILLARRAADLGTSEQTSFPGIADGTNVLADSLVGAIKTVTTLRQFCARYAKYVWNLMLTQKMPPANWADWNFKPPEKYAAFDFFHGVTSPASLNPPDGLIRQPTEAELHASATNSLVKIIRADRNKSQKVTLAAEVTHGNVGVSENYPRLAAP